MNIFSKIKKQLFPDPEIGQIYVFRANVGNPFDRNAILVVDVKNGWIQYVLVGGNGNRFSKTIRELREFWVLE